MNWIDAVVIFLLAVNAFIDYKRGFIVSVYRVFSWTISIFIASNLYPYLTSFLKGNTNLYSSIKVLVENHLVSGTSGSVDDIINIPLPSLVKEKLTETLAQQGNIVRETLTTTIADFSIKALSLILLVIIITIGLKILVKILDLIAHLPVLNFFNRNMGMLFGVLTGVVQLWVIGAVLTYMSINVKYEELFIAIKNSKLGSYFYNNNIILNIITGTVK